MPKKTVALLLSLVSTSALALPYGTVKEDLSFKARTTSVRLSDDSFARELGSNGDEFDPDFELVPAKNVCRLVWNRTATEIEKTIKKGSTFVVRELGPNSWKPVFSDSTLNFSITCTGKKTFDVGEMMDFVNSGYAWSTHGITGSCCRFDYERMQWHSILSGEVFQKQVVEFKE